MAHQVLELGHHHGQELVGMDGDTSPTRGRRGGTRLTFFSPPRYSEDHHVEGKRKGLLSGMIVTER